MLVVSIVDTNSAVSKLVIVMKLKITETVIVICVFIVVIISFTIPTIIYATSSNDDYDNNDLRIELNVDNCSQQVSDINYVSISSFLSKSRFIYMLQYMLVCMMFIMAIGTYYM